MMKQIIDILHNEGLTLVVMNEGEIHRFTQRGVRDLLALVNERPEVLRDAIIADKAVGKAAAACMVVGGVRQVHADVMSKPALELLQRHGVEAQFGQLVDHIINRSGNGWCPMELMSRDLNEPAIIVGKIKELMSR